LNVNNKSRIICYSPRRMARSYDKLDEVRLPHYLGVILFGVGFNLNAQPRIALIIGSSSFRYAAALGLMKALGRENYVIVKGERATEQQLPNIKKISQ